MFGDRSTQVDWIFKKNTAQFQLDWARNISKNSINKNNVKNYSICSQCTYSSAIYC